MEFNKVSLIIIGSELTRGVIKDGHGQLISKELSNLNYEVRRFVVVPDDAKLYLQLKQFVKDSDIIIFTGGLGPTTDDLTRSVIAKVAGVELVKDQEAWDYLYKQVGDKIYGANETQAFIPKGFTKIPNPKGTAPGFRGFIDKKTVVIAMPGPPVEMQEMFFHQVLPYLAKIKGSIALGRTEYTSFLTPESKLEDVCQKVHVGNVEWGTRFQDLRISLYLTGGTKNDREQMGNNLKQALGHELILEGDWQANDRLIDYLKEHKLTVSTAESCTAGWLGKIFTDEAGSSDWYWGGVNSYANDAKEKLLNVDLSKFSAVSEETAIAMAEGIRKISNTDLAMSITGYAGPTGGEKDRPIGTVIFGFASKDKKSQAVKIEFSLKSRIAIRKRSIVASSILALDYLGGANLLDTKSDWQYI